MNKPKTALLLVGIVLIVIIAGYFSAGYVGLFNSPDSENSPSAVPSESANATTTPTASSQTDASASPTSTASASPAPTSSSTPSVSADYSAYSATSTASTLNVAAAQASNKGDHDKTSDYVYTSSEIVDITLNKNSVTVPSGVDATASGTTVTINSAGTYRITGTLDDGRVIVSASSQAVVRLILNGVKITCTTNAPIYAATADKVIIILADGTENTIADTPSNQDDATIYCKTDLTICGNGALSVIANHNDAIRSSDGLIIKNGNIQVTSVDDGITGKDYIAVKGGTIAVNSAGDSLKSDNDEDATRGYITIEAGTLVLTSTSGDGVSAETDLLITGGTLTVTTGGGAKTVPTSTLSTKGLKGQNTVVIDDGDFTINSSDDAIHSNGTIVINNGKFEIATGDDAVHADTKLEVNGGSFAITQCFEGLESAAVTINNGYIQIASSDDGLNAAGGNDGSSTDWAPPGQGGGMPATGNYSLVIRGGFIYVDAYGDGLDINGWIEMSGGILIVNGPLANDNGAIDYDTTCKVTGGTIIASGSAGMAMAPSTTSTVNSVLIRFSTTQTAGKLINIQNAAGETLLTFAPSKTSQSLSFTSTKLTTGSYTLNLGGSTTGTSVYGVYESGTYNLGTKYATFTITSTVTRVG